MFLPLKYLTEIIYIVMVFDDYSKPLYIHYPAVKSSEKVKVKLTNNATSQVRIVDMLDSSFSSHGYAVLDFRYTTLSDGVYTLEIYPVNNYTDDISNRVPDAIYGCFEVRFKSSDYEVYESPFTFTDFELVNICDTDNELLIDENNDEMIE